VSTENPHLPLDATAREQLAATGLRLDRLDVSDRAAFAAWFRAESRGFMSPAMPDDRIDQRLSYLKPTDLLTGVWDSTAADPDSPVGTIESWVADLTLPGGTSVPAWAISGVTVAPTHRRRGIARALLEMELRDAARADVPIAMLTVSESTIYGRFGFAPAALARDLVIDTRRAVWTGPEAPGRVHFVTAEQVQADGYEIVERVRLATPGQMLYSGVLWDRQLGLMLGDDNAKNLRFVRYDDAGGRPQGFAVYSVAEDETDFAKHTLALHTLVAATNDAYAGLWRFLLEMDLVSTVKAHLRPVDEPLRWMVSDFRAIQATEFDHLWIRILDVPAALGARTYAAPGRVVLSVTDPFGACDGSWALEVDSSGNAIVTPTGEPADVSLTAEGLAAIYLGGVSPLMLSAAGQLSGRAAELEAMFRSPVAPFLSIWF
jgi:predicted acetyltransferase